MNYSMVERPRIRCGNNARGMCIRDAHLKAGGLTIGQNTINKVMKTTRVGPTAKKSVRKVNKRSNSYKIEVETKRQNGLYL